eukprot:266890_1
MAVARGSVKHAQIVSVVIIFGILFTSIYFLSTFGKYLFRNNHMEPITVMTEIIATPSIEKYTVTNFHLCDIAYKSNIVLGAHHKTSTILLLYLLTRKGIVPIIRDKCDYKWDQNRFITHYHLSGTFINEFLTLPPRLHNRNTNHYVVINIVRDPVDTVLSAYNYHAKGAEIWTRTPVVNISLLPAKYNNAESLRCSSEVFMHLVNEYQIANGHTYSVETLYKKRLNLVQGIEFEYQRYVKCCFDEIYSSYDTIKGMMYNARNGIEINGLKWNDTLLHLWNFKTEDFAYNYNKSCEILLNKIGVLDDEDRREFMNRFQKFDINSVENIKAAAKKKHVTKGKFNKTEQIEILLGDINRCVVLKKQTKLLDYQWTYDHFC